MWSKVGPFIEKEGLLKGVSRVIAAVSGGADSAAMLVLLCEKAAECGFEVLCAHYNHALRGAESDADEAAVRALCQKLSIPFITEKGDGAARSEEAARKARYDFLARTAQAYAPCVIATAHTLTDNAETVLFRLARGTGLNGACGIPAKNGCIIRPLLCVSREETEEFCRQRGIRFVTDSSNADLSFSRNRIRHRVLPELMKINPNAARHIAAFTACAGRAQALAAGLAEPYLEQESIELAPLKKEPEAVRAYVLEAFLRKNGVDTPSSSMIARLWSLCEKGGRAQMGGGIFFYCRYGRLFADHPATVPDARPFIAAGTDFGAYRVFAEEGAFSRRFSLRRDALAGAVTLRAPQKGDEYEIPGVGKKAVSRLLIERKVPRPLRARLPLLEKEGRILWIMGIGASAAFRAENGEDYINITAEEQKNVGAEN